MADKKILMGDSTNSTLMHDMGSGVFVPVVWAESTNGSAQPISGIPFTDDTGNTFLARDNGISLSYIKLDGSIYVPGANIRPVYASPVLAPISGQAKITVTGQAVQLPANACKNGIIGTVISASNKTVLGSQAAVNGNVSDGSSPTGGDVKIAGQGFAFACSNSNQVWFNGTAGDYLTFSGN